MERPPNSPPDGALAAADLGSNSFHLVVAQEEAGEVRMVDRLRERVALAEGLGEEGDLDGEVAARALACLDRFGQRMKGMDAERVRAVGTATFRRLRRKGFRAKAEEALGFPIEVVPGREEARLIYLGVAQTLGDDSGRRLVIDIGGASTECVLGERFESVHERSLSMGCVRWTMAHFPGGKISAKRMARARIAARLELEPIEEEFRRYGWSSCIGASGTIRAAAEIARRQGWGAGSLTREGLGKLEEALVQAGHIDAVHLEGLEPERQVVIAGGVAVLSAVFEGLGLEAMTISKGALREGVLYDLLGRIHHEDVRSRSVTEFADRFGVDSEQSRRVEDTATELFDQVESAWKLRGEERRLLGWGAQLHEVGLTISWLSYHKHGAYLVANADLRGFSRQVRDTLALLVRAHRRRPPVALIDDLPKHWRKRVRRIVLLLRLAVRLHRGRGATSLPRIELELDGTDLTLRFPEGWLDDHPLTRADIEDEARVLSPLGFALATC
jgi:exopolyphosphatase/guanosine-5'-triphosphate,3'-diphosphate pyrophosphatase